MIISIMILAVIFLCWGSFLNVVAYRSLHTFPVFAKRSRCPWCKTILSWHDLIPVLSWFILAGKCRRCKQPISYLYPLIEMITMISFLGLFYLVHPHYFIAYAFFFSALIISIRTDLESMLIVRYFTYGIIPFAWLFSALHLLPISLPASILGTLFGYFVLWIVRHIYWRITGLIGIGQGDLELLAAIGAFLGALNCWITLLIGSLLGSIIGIINLTIHKGYTSKSKLPFGPYLAIAALFVTLFQKLLLRLLLSI